MSKFLNTDGNIKSRASTLPTVNFNFMLRVEGVIDVPLKSVRAIHKENEYDQIQEGGVNDYVHLIRKPITKPFTLEIERYVGIDFYDPLSLGTKLLLPMFLNVGRYLDPALFLPERQYLFNGCEVISKEYGNLDGEKSGLLTEVTRIAFQTMFVIDSPLDGSQPLWEFEGTTKKGNGETNRNKSRAPLEDSREDMAKRTQRWSMAKSQGLTESRKDVSISSRQNLVLKNDLDASIDTMAGKAKKWEFSQKKMEGNGKTSASTPITLGYQDKQKNSAATMATTAEKHHWGFTEDGAVFGNQKTSATTALKKGLQKPEDSVENMRKAATDHYWEFNKYDPEGNGKHSATNADRAGLQKPTDTVANMRAEATKHYWEFTTDGAALGNEKQSAGTAVNKNIQKPEYSSDNMKKTAGDHHWEFADDGATNGNEKQSASTPLTMGLQKSEYSSDSMKKTAADHHWQFSQDGATAGQGKQSATTLQSMGVTGETVLSKEDMKGKASQWPPKKSAQNIADFLNQK